MQQNFIELFNEMPRLPGARTKDNPLLFSTYSTLKPAWANFIFVKSDSGIGESELKSEIEEFGQLCDHFMIYFKSTCKNIPENYLRDNGFSKSVAPNFTKPIAGPEDIRSIDRFQIRRVEHAKEYDAFMNVFSDVFALDPMTAQKFKQWQIIDGFGSKAKTKNFIGMYHNEVVATGSHFIHEKYCGFYNIGVLEEYRRHGLGKRITQFVITDGFNRGATEVGCYSSEEGINVYKGLGLKQGKDLWRFTK